MLMDGRIAHGSRRKFSASKKFDLSLHYGERLGSLAVAAVEFSRICKSGKDTHHGNEEDHKSDHHLDQRKAIMRRCF
jgi:hypothetical protein